MKQFVCKSEIKRLLPVVLVSSSIFLLIAVCDSFSLSNSSLRSPEKNLAVNVSSIIPTCVPWFYLKFSRCQAAWWLSFTEGVWTVFIIRRDVPWFIPQSIQPQLYAARKAITMNSVQDSLPVCFSISFVPGGSDKPLTIVSNFQRSFGLIFNKTWNKHFLFWQKAVIYK